MKNNGNSKSANPRSATSRVSSISQPDRISTRPNLILFPAAVEDNPGINAPNLQFLPRRRARARLAPLYTPSLRFYGPAGAKKWRRRWSQVVPLNHAPRNFPAGVRAGRGGGAKLIPPVNFNVRASPQEESRALAQEGGGGESFAGPELHARACFIIRSVTSRYVHLDYVWPRREDYYAECRDRASIFSALRGRRQLPSPRAPQRAGNLSFPRRSARVIWHLIRINSGKLYTFPMFYSCVPYLILRCMVVLRSASVCTWLDGICVSTLLIDRRISYF